MWQLVPLPRLHSGQAGSSRQRHYCPPVSHVIIAVCVRITWPHRWVMEAKRYCVREPFSPLVCSTEKPTDVSIHA